MIEYDSKMAAYDIACRKFEQAQITYDEVSVDGYKVTFKISKGGASCTLIVDCASPYAEQQIENGIAAFEELLNWQVKEQERQSKKKRKKNT